MTDRRQVLADIDHALIAIRRELDPATASMAGKASTGYPTSTRPGHGITHNPGHADPVGETASPKTHRRATAPHADLAHLDHALLEAARQLAHARGLIHKHTPTSEAQPDTGEPGCASCSRIGQHTPRWRGDLCRWCYDYRTVHRKGQADMPAPSLVKLYHQHGRITTRDVQNAGVRL